MRYASQFVMDYNQLRDFHISNSAFCFKFVAAKIKLISDRRAAGLRAKRAVAKALMMNFQWENIDFRGILGEYWREM